MQAHARYGQAAYSIVVNTVIQTQARTAYYVSGGACSPGTSSTEITTKVDQGQVNINGAPVNFTGGEPVHPAADASPRVDVVSVTATGDFDVTAGTPEAFAPTEDENGDPITTHTPFHHWTPAPNSGADVQGVPLCLVLVRPDTTAGTDLTDEEVNDDILRIEGSTQAGFVRGDGTDNDEVTITANDADFAVQDQTDSNARYLWRDHSEKTLTIGAEDSARPTLGAPLDANDFNVDNLNALGFGPDATQNLDFDSSTGPFTVRDTAASPAATPFGVDDTHIHARRPVDVHGVQIQNPNQINYQGGGADQTLWSNDDGATNPTVYQGRSNPGVDPQDANYSAFDVFDATNLSVLFRVTPDGAGYLHTDAAGQNRIATRPWASGEFFKSRGGVLRLDQKAADPTAPADGGVLLYESQDAIEAKYPNGDTVTLGTRP